MSGELPHHLAVLLNRLCIGARLFIKLFKKDESRMAAIAAELQEISDEFGQVKSQTFRTSAGGTVLGGVGAGVFSLAAVGIGSGKVPVSAGGVSLLMGGATATVSGVMTVFKAIAKKSMTEKELIKTVAQLNTQLIVMFQPLRNLLEDIIKVSEELAVKSSVLVTTVGVPAYFALSEIERFQQLQSERHEPSEYTDPALFISQSAVKSQKTADELAKMRSALREFEEN